MDEDEAVRLLHQLLDGYGSYMLQTVLRQDHTAEQIPMYAEQMPVFIEGIYSNAVFICSKADVLEPGLVLRGRDAAEVAVAVYDAFKRMDSLVSTLSDGKQICIKLGDGTGRPEKFMIECALHGLA